jgi:metal-dependent hydrolase (beta-lactamase superfamily II)
MHLSSGNDLFENQHWQAVPGDEHARIFPYIRKVDTNSSNSFIISTPGQIILIDPGGFAGQMDMLAAEIESINTFNKRPVFIYLTHAHIDHFIVMQTHPFFRDSNRYILAAHANGAVSL